MLENKGLGRFENAPQIAVDIATGNIDALDGHLRKKWNIDKKIKTGEHSQYTPISIALIANSFASVKWLVEHGVNLNQKYNHSFLVAVRYCDENIIRYIVEHGAKVIGDDPNTDAFEQALFGEKIENLPLIHSLGHTVEQYGGNAFRGAIMNGNMPAVTFFVENAVDINYNAEGMYGKPTPLCVAARYTNLEMCKYLVAHGADVTLGDKDGMRPYNIALERGEMEMAAFFKSLEPAGYHDLQNKLSQLKTYKLPAALLDFLQGENRRFDFGAKTSLRGCEYIDFLALSDTMPVKAGRQKVLQLSREIENYSPGTHIVWNPKTKMIAYYDAEHGELADMASFDDFIGSVEKYIMQHIVGGVK